MARKQTHGFLSKHQRDIYAKGIIEWGNLVFIGLVVAQFVPGTYPFRKGILVVGILIFVGAYIAAYFLTKGGGFDD